MLLPVLLSMGSLCLRCVCLLRRFFWAAMEKLPQEQRSRFIEFVYGRSRLPPSADAFPMHFKIDPPTPVQRRGGDNSLPSAATCFFKLK